uniref:Uncharacterized protein n=1 Tax=Biomphalaria glabrata TaxID=6526 RepID=A0A2C9KIJ1_BIOGL
MDNDTRSNIELAEKLHKSELKLTELHQEAQNTNAYLERERQKCADLEENLCSSTLARQLDLRDIWRLVQKDVETECQEQQEDAFSAIDSEQIKEKIKRDIEVLRSKLHHREATLGTLQNQSSTSSGLFNCSHLQHSSNWYASGQRLSPGSTLVDALTIDVLNGNLPTYPVKMPSPISCEDVDCYECRAARLVAQNSDTPQNYKLQLFLEDVQAYTVPKSMEDWDMAPQSTGYDQDQEHIENLSDPDQELPDVSTYMNESDDMQESVNLSSQKKEPVHVHGTKDNSAILDLDVKNIQIKSSIAPHQGAGRPALYAKHDPAPASSKTASNISQPPTPSASLEALPPLPVPHNSSGGTEAGRGSLSTNGGGTHKLSSAIPSSGIQATSETHKIVLPPSPPSPRSGAPFSLQPQPLAPTRLSELRQLHLANKRKDQIKSRNMKLPELSENSELDITSAGISPINPCTLSPNPSSPSKDKGMPQISVTDYLEPPPPTDDPVTPSLPSSFLKKLGLSVKETSPSSQIEEKGESEVSVDQLPQKELESKFISLSLAFKTDKFTLQQRVKVQERSRDLAEQNVDSEIKSFRELLESLYEQVSEPQARTIVQKLRQNIDVLEQTAARVSSRAEVYGAVQQEQRMCQALEVMVLYTENLKRIREREESELLEARKVLSERTVNGYSVDTDSTSGRRSMSVSGISPGGRPMPTISSSLHCVTESGDYTKNSCMRRRSEIALPKVLGGSGSPSMIQTASLETASPFLDRSYPSFNLLGVFAETGEDPKSRFQSAVASMSMQHAVTSTVRQASLEKQRSMSFTPSLSPSSSLGSPFSPSTPSHQSISSVTESGRKISQDEDAFRKGYEEGLKAKLSRELNELREQQNCISHNLEHMMDRVDQTEQEEEEFLSRPTRLDTLLGYSTRFTQKLLQHDWRSNKKLIRNLAGFFLVFLAIFIVFLSPPISTVDIRQITRPPT